ncbi:MAG TPA: hypothetical protein VG944_04355, partial [Fimbriimonas sp.]|nr:hypothetical protein [Fimbriimonas sp.]
MPDSSTLPVDAILTRLGVEGPVSTDLQGLRKVYRAWCLSVPFDNSVKVQTLTQDPNAAMPILDPAEFFESWLRKGTGGTCWAHGNALYSFLKAL